jgi:hypothetical protein
MGIVSVIAATVAVAALFIPGINVAVLGAAMLQATVLFVITSAIEYELRIRAAGVAKTGADFQRETEFAAAARTNVLFSIGGMVVGVVVKLLARVPLGPKLQTVGNALKLARESLARTKPGMAFVQWRLNNLAALIKLRDGIRESLTATKNTIAEESRVFASLKNGKDLLSRIAKGNKELEALTGISPEKARELMANPEIQPTLDRIPNELTRATKTAAEFAERQASQMDAHLQETIDELRNVQDVDQTKAVLGKAADALSEEVLMQQSLAAQEAYIRTRLSESVAFNDNVEVAHNDNVKVFPARPGVGAASGGTSGASGRFEGNLALKTESSPSVMEVTPDPYSEPVPQSSAQSPTQEPKLAQVIPLPQPEPVLSPPVAAPAQAPKSVPSPEVVPKPVTEPAAQSDAPVTHNMHSPPSTMDGASTPGEITASGARPRRVPVMRSDLSRAEQELWRTCNQLHDTYKNTQDEGADYASRSNLIEERLENNRATAQDRVDYCALLDKLIQVVQREHRERTKYIKFGCDKINWFDDDTTEDERRASHQAALSQIDTQLRNLYQSRKAFCP